MSKDVKPKRAYDSRRRKLGAIETRQAILDAAHRKFITEGWTRTTIAAIAAEAGVAPETIYAAFGTKRAIIAELVQRAVRGGQPAVPLLEQQERQRVMAAPGHKAQIAAFAEDISDVLARVAPLIAVVREGAGEPDLARLYADLHGGRRRNLAVFAEALLARGPLRGGLDRDAATAIMWRLASPELFLLMRDVEGLDLAAYAGWLTASLERQLLDG